MVFLIDKDCKALMMVYLGYRGKLILVFYARTIHNCVLNAQIHISGHDYAGYWFYGRQKKPDITCRAFGIDFLMSLIQLEK